MTRTPSNEFFAADGGELMDDLKKPLLIAGPTSRRDRRGRCRGVR